MTGTRTLLVGGGHAHVEVLRRAALAPDPRVALTVVSPDPLTPYSGMLPGLVAGHYTIAESHIALAPLARAAGARLLASRVVALDLAARRAALADGTAIDFDLVSLDVGSVPDRSMPGAREHAIGVKPVDAFLAAFDALAADVAAGRVRDIAVVGGGAAGVEIVLAMDHRLRATTKARPAFTLVSDAPDLLPRHAPGVRRRVARVLAARGVRVVLGRAVAAIEPGRLRLADGDAIACGRAIVATTATAPPWIAAAGFACDARGFLRVDATLRSVSHPFAFGAGDCATQDGPPYPKSGVYAVRQGPPLAHNLRAAAHGEALVAYRPQRRSLALISTGDRRAIASRGPIVAAGAWVWRWKDRIDRRFMSRYRDASTPRTGTA